MREQKNLFYTLIKKKKTSTEELQEVIRTNYTMQEEYLYKILTNYIFQWSLIQNFEVLSPLDSSLATMSTWTCPYTSKEAVALIKSSESVQKTPHQHFTIGTPPKQACQRGTKAFASGQKAARPPHTFPFVKK